MAKLSPKQFQEKHNRRLKGALEDIRTGVDNVTESPTAKAAKKAEKMRANLIEAIDSGKWANRLNAVTLDQWKEKMRDVGVGRISQGIDAASDKVVAFAEELLPFIESRQNEIKKMPDVTLEDNINRMVTFIRGMSKFERKK
jgi:hypothetical protein